MAEHDGDDMHDWETFNQQIEKLLLSMQKTDRAAFASPRSNVRSEHSLPRSVGHQQRPSFASILEHASLRQNLSEGAFQQAAEVSSPVHNATTSANGMKDAASLQPVTGPRIDRSPAQDLQPFNSEAATPANVQPTISSCEKQTPSTLEEIPCSRPASTDESDEAWTHACHASAGAQSRVVTNERSVDTALEREMQSMGDAEQASVSPATVTLEAGIAGMQEEEKWGGNPYRLLLQQIDLHIATCQASLASIYPTEQDQESAEPATPAHAQSVQATVPFPRQRSIYRNELHEALPENLDSPCGRVGADSKRGALAAAPQLFAEEVNELMAAEATHAQPAMPIASPSFPMEDPGAASSPAKLPPSAEMAKAAAEQDAQRQLTAADRPSPGHVAEFAVDPREGTAGQRAALAEQHMPQDSALELDAGHGSGQALHTAFLPAEETPAGHHHAHGSGSGEPHEACSPVVEQEESVPQACSAVPVPTTAASGTEEPSGTAQLVLLRNAASGNGDGLEALDEVEQEQAQLIGAWWPPGPARPDQATSRPGPGSREPMHRQLGAPPAWLPQRAVSVKIRDAERRTASPGQQGANAAFEGEQDTERSPCRILRLSLSPPCSGHRGDPAGEDSIVPCSVLDVGQLMVSGACSIASPVYQIISPGLYWVSAPAPFWELPSAVS